MFENVENTPLNSFTKSELLTHLNKNATLDSNNITTENSGLSFHSLSWNNFVHFDLSFTPWKHLGYKIAVASLLADLTTGKKPDYLTLDIVSSSKYTLEALEELCNGFFHASQELGFKGRVGNVSTTAQGIYLNTTAINTQPSYVPITHEVNEGDLICVTGDLGAAYLGLLLLEREKRIFAENPQVQPDLEGKDYIVGKQLKPKLPFEVLNFIKDEKILLSAIANTDQGLSVALNAIKEQYGQGIIIYEDKLPIDNETLMQCIDFGIDGTVAALNGGEDYELVFVIPQSEFEKISKLKTVLSIIGYVSNQTADVLISLKSGRTEKVNDLKIQ